MNKRIIGLIFGSAVLVPLSMQPASATTTFATGNAQATNVNIAAAIDALSIVGDIGNTGLTMTWINMIGPDGTQVSMHGQHGVAFIESTYDATNSPHTGFQSLTLLAQSGYGWSGGDFALDQLNNSTAGNVTFTPYDQFGPATCTVCTLALDTTGQSQYHWTTSDGELLTKIIITVSTANMLQDFKQLSLDAAVVTPLPAALPLFATGLGALGLLGWRRKRKNSAAAMPA
jgi:hypothetical protein